ncbi:TRAP transporter, DctM subunit [Tranquillimonas rosea]|uniref:TRAP transporter, DctM subunit n=1 Tax=Tranquillimonas rosea TaxID=641238 RepID=A0A1H9WJH4_9RHOB|nr:TRAP transporter large permease subunit [Tranquillimonas rosea]SES34030.1 TRAP transporter, DctM subunit [Tranquillimonas rosea]
MTGADAALVAMLLALFGGILSGIPAMLAIAGVPLVSALIASTMGVFDLQFLTFFPARVWGIMSNTLLMAVPLFVLMGVLLERSGLAQRMLDVLSRLVRGSPRGIALAVLAFSTLIAASTGIIGATVVMLVLIALPAMTEAGIDKRLAAGVICASGTLGQIIPPSILLVLLGDQIGSTYLEAQQAAGNFAPDPVSVGDLFAGALLPGLVLVSLYAVFIAIMLRPARGPVPVEGAPVTARLLVFTFLPPIALIVAVLGSILAGIATTTEAAGLGAVGALLLAASGKAGRAGRALVAAAALGAVVLIALRLADVAGPVAVIAALLVGIGTLAGGVTLFRGGILAGAVDETVKITGMVFGIVVAASLLSLVFRGFGGDERVADLIAAMPGGTASALALVLAIVFLLGFILEAIEIIYIVVPLLGPPILGTDISPVWFGVLLAMNLQTSFLTPPFGFALFYFRSAAPRSISTTDIYVGVAPFVGLQILAMALLIAVPELATWLPDLMFR